MDRRGGRVSLALSLPDWLSMTLWRAWPWCSLNRLAGPDRWFQPVFCAERTVLPALSPEDRGGVTLDLVKQVVDSP